MDETQNNIWMGIWNVNLRKKMVIINEMIKEKFT
jgi:hypothetical protein